MVLATKLPVDTSADAYRLADNMFGEGVQLVSASYTGDPLSKGVYTGASSISPGAVPSDSGIILSTGRADGFTNATGSGDANQNDGYGTDVDGGVDGNPILDDAAGVATFDGSILEAEFIPQGPTLTMQLVFSSDEYPEYAGTGYNDVVRIIVNGQVVQLSIGSGEVSINNITNGGVNVDGNDVPASNPNLYLDNTGSQFNTEMDGLTITLTMKAPVVPGEVNSIWIGIADAGDGLYDSNLMIVADSVQTSVIANEDFGETKLKDSLTMDVLANDTVSGENITLTITQINGQNVSPGDSVTLPSGSVVMLNPDGTLTFDGSGTGTETFTYQISNGAGTTDTGFATVNVTCFVKGTLIETPNGPVPIETLKAGDLVQTRDREPQPIVWIGRSHLDRSVLEQHPRLKPIRIMAGALGPALPLANLTVSPQHRILICSKIAQSMFGIGEVLIAAKQLLAIDGIETVEDGDGVEYFHILLPQHDIVFSNGAWTESLFTGAQALQSLSDENREEIRQIFPEITDERWQPDAARFVPKGRLSRDLAERHAACGLALAY
ncbi:Hint domain-containing protein [Falsirhodobacter halotolerans]|uniref:Hint domain-containing protein n=1 Tax=Falsirhodobacter halotolerans TaxID=1146892 RepID=UPI001FCF83CF|nr:Hint domain-containing protein [Falsirhodobacter halotolerans]MCJ8139862.1 Hint domain-containing protein [Falsirhodobacter halotolerans]